MRLRGHSSNGTVRKGLNPQSLEETQVIVHTGKDARIEEARYTMKEVGQAIQYVSRRISSTDS
jgi:hypothetical protein